LELPVQARLFPILCDVLDGFAVQVADQGEVVVALGNRLLIDAQPGDDGLRLGSQPSRDGFLLDAPGFLPAEVQDARGSFGVSLFQDVDRLALEEQRETGQRFRPRELDALDPVLGGRRPAGFWRAGGS
jgi:hypothetical protein